jgi:hypothetical protein
MSFALITAILAVAFALFGRPACGGEIVDCVEAPGSGRWVYRIIDERQCWFPARGLRRGEEKPLEELALAKPIITDPLSEFEGRWRGGAAEGWDHKE